MIVINPSLRDMESLLDVSKTSWDTEDVPDHNTIGNPLDTIDEDWLQSILARTARMCMESAGWTSGSTASDSSGVETDRYEAVKKNRLEKRRKKYSKHHATSILGLLIVLDSRMTPTRHEGIGPDDRDDTRAGGWIWVPSHTVATLHTSPRKTSGYCLSINWIPTSGRDRPA